MDIKEKVIECAAEIYGVDASEITLETDIREELSNQSIKLIAFISSIEDELDASIAIPEAGGLKTIGDFVKKVEELLA